jgi:proteasome lid subunit RPN8/RPN11
LAAPVDAARFFKARLLDLPHEVFSCLFLDTRHRLIRYEELFRGTIDGATVYPREVVKRALQHNAAAVIVGHNHPSGVSEPSEADRNITLSWQGLGAGRIGCSSPRGESRRPCVAGGKRPDLSFRALPRVGVERYSPRPFEGC